MKKNVQSCLSLTRKILKTGKIGLLSSILFLSGNFSAINQSYFTQQNTSPPLSFTENKGQVKNQFGYARPDVVYSGYYHGTVFHLRNNGVSYQFYKHKGNEHEVYRLDVNWPGANTRALRQAELPLPSLEHYYNTVNGIPALNVRSYEGVFFKNIYKGIDLHYYQKAGKLKYDYLIYPGANYRNILLQIEGADNIRIGEDGSVVIKTPFGTITEGAPLVYQGKKIIPSKWVLKNNLLGFELGHYNPSLPLIIDPVTRSWGTYYGGTGSFAITLSNGCYTDALGNVYMTGSTDTNSGIFIATSGSHQSAFAGSLDAFLAKFNSSGVRLWGTYYGGTGNDNGNKCAVDVNGNVFMAGQSSSASNIATAGAYQTTMAGVADAMLVKFNSNGVRQWGTYFGGSLLDHANACTVDASSSVYITGGTKSTSGISTTGSHQSSFGGGTDDAFIAKFGTTGALIWSSYYGDSGVETGASCKTDALGNIYMCGATTSNAGISTSGAFQISNAGGSNEGFLVKFNSTGVRQWATFYGGPGLDKANGCTTDAAGNVYVAGETSSTSGIATIGSYQASYSGGASDAYLVKFDAAGSRLWASYLGGSGLDEAEVCTTDLPGNVLIAGKTDSGAGITSSGNHQVSYGGGTRDGMLVKFNATGTYLWGSYYGGSGNDDCTDVTVSATGLIYITGSTSTNFGTAIATSGSHQDTFYGTNDGFMAQFTDCIPPNAPVNTTSASNLTLCSNSSATISASGSGPINWYNSATSTSTLNTGTSLITPVLAIGIHTFFAETTNTCSASQRTAISVTVNPVITINSGAICLGSSFTLSPVGAVSYTFPGGNPVVSPLVTTSYTVNGVDAWGCFGSVISNVVVNQLPVLSVNSGSMCSGNSFTIQPLGAASYTISGGNAIVSPGTSTTYIVNGTSADGCPAASAVISSVTVIQAPVANVTSARPVICKGESVKISVSGASTYSWSTGFTGTFITVSPTITTAYTVTASGANSCSTKIVHTQSVNACTGFSSSDSEEKSWFIYPNPGSGIFYLENSVKNTAKNYQVFNAIGELVLKGSSSADWLSIDLTEHTNGVYYLRLESSKEIIVTHKLVKQ